MHFFKDDKERLRRPRFGVFDGCLGKLPYGLIRLLGTVFKGEDRACPVGLLLSILVVLLHLWLVLELLEPVPRRVKPKPVVITVSLMAAPSKPASVSPPVPIVERPKMAESKAVEAKQRIKPAIQKKPAALPKQSEQPKPVADKVVAPLSLPVAEMPGPQFDAFKSAVKEAVPAVKPPPSATAVAAKENESASCVACPVLKFPAIAQRRGWQGSVLLKFQLTPTGLAENITVARSSGHELLDEAAIDNAKESRFTTANAGQLRHVTKSYKFTLKEE